MTLIALMVEKLQMCWSITAVGGVGVKGFNVKMFNCNELWSMFLNLVSNYCRRLLIRALDFGIVDLETRTKQQTSHIMPYVVSSDGIGTQSMSPTLSSTCVCPPVTLLSETLTVIINLKWVIFLCLTSDSSYFNRHVSVY